MHITVYFRKGNKIPFITLLCGALILCILVPLLCSRCYFTPSRSDTPQVYGVPLHQMLMEEGSSGRPGTHRAIRYVVIHETANTNTGADAMAHAQLLQSGQNGTTSWHYSVDDHQICQSIPDDEMGYLFNTVKKIAELKGIAESGYRVIVNTNDDAQQSVHHIHVHVLGGAPMNSGDPSAK